MRILQGPFVVKRADGCQLRYATDGDTAACWLMGIDKQAKQNGCAQTCPTSLRLMTNSILLLQIRKQTGTYWNLFQFV